MSDMQFNTDETAEFGRPPEQKQGFDLSGKLIQWGLVADRQQASYVLIGIAGLALVAALFFMFSGGGGDAPPLLPQ